ncbi:sodium/glutamate symporter [Corynebacterium bovis]|uniref:sodium/glutamate symporter n=1 Tax=Corynebacterium bovis TaxID=36808 RepID=UPI000F6364B4|nr:sodium:glutamate symporter [Corynebacterium bovis]RRO84731.1 sodium:glutamate symporter [Corynebacterium bovis]
MGDTFTPYSILVDVGWISALLVVGNLLRRFIPLFQTLMIPAPITAGLLGLALGPEGLGLIHFSDQLGTYSSILIAVVFGAMPYSMEFNPRVRRGARTMWSYSVGMYVGQWGIFTLFGIIVLGSVWGTPDWFGMMLPVGFVGGFGTAAAVGGSLQQAGGDAAMTLGFTSATVGTLAAIVGGIIFAKWGSATGRTAQLPEFSRLPRDLRTGLISLPGQRPSVGKATTNPSSIEPVALHVSVIAVTVFVAYLVCQGINSLFPSVSIPLFAMAFVIGLIGLGVLHLVKNPGYIDRDLMGSLSGGSTDYLVAFGVASIVPTVVAAYAVPLLILFIVGVVYCLLLFFLVAPKMFGHQWIERAIFGWGWATASVATAIAILKIVDPRMKSGTLEEFGVAYVGYAPFEIGLTILAPIAVIAGVTTGFGIAATIVAVIVLALAFVLKWPQLAEVDAVGEPAAGDAASGGS